MFEPTSTSASSDEEEQEEKDGCCCQTNYEKNTCNGAFISEELRR